MNHSPFWGRRIGCLGGLHDRATSKRPVLMLQENRSFPQFPDIGEKYQVEYQKSG